MSKYDDLCARLELLGEDSCPCNECKDKRSAIFNAVRAAIRELETNGPTRDFGVQRIDVLTGKSEPYPVTMLMALSAAESAAEAEAAYANEQRERAERAEAERDALRADAERYRWLRANARRIDFAGISWTQGCELDARIDTALREGK